tara:strand:+ start:210 stop:395 length:186 start_codon:yes stop_codon:yes gene_type:complete
MTEDKIGGIFAWIQGQAFSTGVLMFSEDLFRAFLLGFVGGMGGLFVRFIWQKFEKNKNKNN